MTASTIFTTAQQIIGQCINIWANVFKNGPSKICGRQRLKNLKWHGLPKQTISHQAC